VGILELTYWKELITKIIGKLFPPSPRPCPAYVQQ